VGYSRRSVSSSNCGVDRKVRSNGKLNSLAWSSEVAPTSVGWGIYSRFSRAGWCTELVVVALCLFNCGKSFVQSNCGESLVQTSFNI
jgi:hypothetical protein